MRALTDVHALSWPSAGRAEVLPSFSKNEPYFSMGIITLSILYRMTGGFCRSAPASVAVQDRRILPVWRGEPDLFTVTWSL